MPLARAYVQNTCSLYSQHGFHPKKSTGMTKFFLRSYRLFRYRAQAFQVLKIGNFPHSCQTSVTLCV